MTRSNFRQRDLERILRAAKAVGGSVQVDLKTLIVKVTRLQDADVAPPTDWLARGGKENWDD
ncbi:hypothetical protein [Agrobacterium cavarae]|uniref:hypothetical protein n=1 Tax=Agrobacterium cavarae TaxID=2528239 RepID=UPI002FF4E4F1